MVQHRGDSYEELTLAVKYTSLIHYDTDLL